MFAALQANLEEEVGLPEPGVPLEPQGCRRTTRGPRPALLGRGPAAVVRLAYSPQD